jgi:hypothetical protein
VTGDPVTVPARSVGSLSVDGLESLAVLGHAVDVENSSGVSKRQ